MRHLEISGSGRFLTRPGLTVVDTGDFRSCCDSGKPRHNLDEFEYFHVSHCLWQDETFPSGTVSRPLKPRDLT